MSTAAILSLPYPLIVLPGARITLPVKRQLGQQLVAHVQDSEAQPVVAAVPLVNSSSNGDTSSKLAEWGCIARIARLVRPAALNPNETYHLTLHGLTRVRIAKSADSSNVSQDELHVASVEYPPSEGKPKRETVAKFKSAALQLLDRLIQDAGRGAKRENWTRFASLVEDMGDDRTGWLADVMVWSILQDYSDKLDFLSAHKVEDRLARATQLFIKQASITEVSKKIANAVDESLSKQQKAFFLRQQLAAIQRELAELERSGRGGLVNSSTPGSPVSGDKTTGPVSDLDDDENAEADDMADIRRRIEAMEPGSEERKMSVREWRRLKRIPHGSVEHGVIRNYLEWLTSLPWPSSNGTAALSSETIRDRSFLSKARSQLDADHYGLEKIKRRLVEYLAVVRLRQLAAEANLEQEKLQMEKEVISNEAKNEKALVLSGDADKRGKRGDPLPPLIPAPATVPKTKTRVAAKGPILLFVGPPGTGKTSLGQSIARALDRPFQRISLGGVRDEAEIRGHRRTYVASGPGSIVQALRKAGRPDPVLLLDEIDKVGQSNFHGDPSAALLEVLDPEQNHSFNDHYINVPIDLSQVLFICTANTLDTIAAPLLDRCEIIELAGYTYDEKIHIARKFLLPKQISANALPADRLELPQDTLRHIATHYTREAGVRSLERAIGAVVRFKAVEWADSQDGKDGVYSSRVEEADLERILGIPRWDGEEREREEKRGIVYGLVVTGMGEGGILPVETISVPGSGQLKLTGSLGDVIKESGELALSWVKRHAYALRITESPMQDPLKGAHPMDIHLHLPAGAQKKDGPSAGIAMTCAFVSLLTGATVPSSIAMTGEITLRGRVTPVGGIKEKVLGAHRANVTKVILPFANRKDVEQDVAREIRDEMDFVFVRTVEEALEAAFGVGRLPWRTSHILVESRL